MAANSSLNLTALDVPTLEQSLKDYLRSTSGVFADYDFDGSNLAALVRLLAYNTYKVSWGLNMVASEGFLDSAQTRSAILSHAKELNYVPDSGKSSKASIQITFNGTSPSYVLQKGVSFSSVVRNRGLVFTLPQTMVLTSTNGYFSVQTDLYEGTYVQDSYVMNYSDETQRFILSNPNVDTDSLTVAVYQDGKTLPDQYVYSPTLLGVTDTSLVYFMQASETNQYEVVFGDGVVGQRPSDGATIILDYRTTLGSDGNGAMVFSRDFDIGEGSSNVQVTTVSTSSGGANAESIESIRYYAPRHFQVQERAVTSEDFGIILKTQFPEIGAVSAYGGEEVDPPQYGKVFIALDVQNVDGIPQSLEDKYTGFLKSRMGMTVQPVFVEPKYLYLSIKTSVLYDVNITTITPSNLQTLVTGAINSYAITNLDDFGTTLRYSRLVADIDDSHPSIVSNSTEIRVYKKVLVTPNTIQSFPVNFDVPVYDGYPISGQTFALQDERALESDTFSVGGETRYITDDGDGNLWTATDRGSTTVLLLKVGTIDYGTGSCQINNLTLEDVPGGIINFYARTQSLDVSSAPDTILMVETGMISVTINS